jgi:gliding motility-associated-like protein
LPVDYNNVTGEWDVNDLAVGAEATLVITALVNPITPTAIFTNLAQIVDTKNLDPNTVNNSSEITVTPFDFTGNFTGDLIGVGGSICANSRAALRATSTNIIDPIYKWYADAQLTNLLHIGANYTTPALSFTTTYFLVVSGTNIPAPTPVDAKQVTVSVLAVPGAPVATITQPTCEVPTGTITVSSPMAPGNTYSLDGATYLNNTGVFSGIAPGTYALSVKNANGCISPNTLVVVNPKPIGPAAPSLNIIHPTCNLGTGTISISSPKNPGNTYSIDGVDYTNTSGLFTQVVAGTYNVTVKNSSGCISGASVAVVNQNPLTPQIPTIEVTNPLCPDKTGIIKITSPTGNGFTYSIDGSTFINNTGVFTSVLPGAYNVSVKNASGCVSPAVVAVVKDPIVDETKLTITAESSTNICLGATVVLTSSISPSYQWYKYGVAISGANSRTFTASTEGVYSVSRYNTNGCLQVISDGIEVKVVVNPIAPLLTADKLLFCFGDSVVLNATSTFPVQWYKDGIQIPSINNRFVAKQGGTYAAIAVNQNGCRSTFSESIVLNMVDLPVTPVLSIIGTSKFCKDESRLLKVVIPNGLTVNWYKNNTLINNYSKDTLRVNDAAEYTVKYMNTSGCLSLVSNKIITEIGCNNTNIYVPDVFSPNGDGINDVVKAVCVGIAKLKFFKIYNRWGNILFETTEESKGWDGRFRGQIQPSDSYIWLVEGIDTNGKEIRKTGTLNLIK